MDNLNKEQETFVAYLRKEHDLLESLSKKGFIYAKHLDQIQKLQEVNLKQLDSQDQCQGPTVQGMVDELGYQGYKDLRILGQGAFGMVFSGKIGSQRSAIKGFVIENEFNGNKYKDKVINEFSIQQELKDYKYVVRAQRILPSGKYIFLVLEECFMSLENLLKLQITDVNNQPILMNEVTFVKIAYDLVSGINSLHKKSIAVKDIKPDNILVNYNFVFQIADLGLSQLLIKPESLKYMQEGNQLYMAPERRKLCVQISEMVNSKQDFENYQHSMFTQKDFLIKSDLFSLGLVLCQVMIGNDKFRHHFFHTYFFKFYENFNEFIEMVYKSMINFKHGSTLINVIKSFCEVEPQNRMSAETALTLITPIYNSLGLNEIKSVCIKQEEQEKLNNFFKDDIEFINTYHDKGILVASEKLISQYSSNVLSKNKGMNSRVFLKSLRMNYLNLYAQPKPKLVSQFFKNNSEVTFNAFTDYKQIIGNNKEIDIHKIPPVLIADNNNSLKELTIKNQFSLPHYTTCTNSNQINDNNNKQQYQKQCSIENKEKLCFLEKVNKLCSEVDDSSKFQSFEDIQIYSLSSLLFRILFIIIFSVSLLEIECELSKYIDIPQLDFFGIFVLRLIATVLQTIFGIYLLKQMFLINHMENHLVLVLVSLLLVCFFTGISVFNNVNSVFSLDQNEDIFSFYSLAAQTVIAVVSLWLFILMFWRKQIKIQKQQYTFYYYFSSSNLLKEYTTIKTNSV